MTDSKTAPAFAVGQTVVARPNRVENTASLKPFGIYKVEKIHEHYLTLRVEGINSAWNCSRFIPVVSDLPHEQLLEVLPQMFEGNTEKATKALNEDEQITLIALPHVGGFLDLLRDLFSPPAPLPVQIAEASEGDDIEITLTGKISDLDEDSVTLKDACGRTFEFDGAALVAARVRTGRWK